MAIWRFTLLIGLSLAFDLNDPKTNLDSVIRTTGSTDPRIQNINYINGTVFLRFPGGTLQKVFLVEGFNIARKVPKSFGYLSLSREFLVYRNYDTGEIIDVFMNPQTRIPNEVFYIHNNPVNGNLTYGEITPFTILENDRVGFNNDILLQYPNVLDPKNYPKYTAGPIYEGDELFQFYTRYSKLATTNIQDLNYTSTWSRRSQFLPWLELGGINGHMYYVSTNWKCLQGFADVPSDILDIVRTKYPDFLNAPDTYEVPNETSWSAFKAVIDQRRKEGKPDIIIPEVGIKTGLRNQPTHLDPIVYETLAKLDSFKVSFSGQVYSEITGKSPINLFKVKGVFTCKVNLTPGGPQIIATINGNFLDPKTDQVVKIWKNPLTNQTNYVPPISGKFGKTLIKGDDSVWSLPVPNLDETAVVGATSHSMFNNATGEEDWSVQLLDVFFPNEDLKSKSPYMYGTWIKYSSWLEWMGMAGDEGLLVWRMNLELLRSESKHKAKSLIGRIIDN